MEKSPTGSRTKRSKGKVVRAFFRTVWTSLKSTLIHRDPNKVVRVQPQPDLPDPEMMHVSSPVRNKPRLDAYPELVCLPGQVCEDLESPCGSGFSRIEQTPDADPVVPELECLPGQVYEEDLEQTADSDPELVCEDPESLCGSGCSRIEQTPDGESADSVMSPISLPSTSDLDDEKTKKGRKKRAVRAFFRRLGRAAKLLFLGHEPDSVQHFTPESDLANSELNSSLISSESESPFGLQYGTRISPFFRVEEFMGSGAYGQVYEGSHIFNERIKVAIKHIPKHGLDRYLDTPDHSKPVLAEVALMLRLGQAPSCPNIIELQHWVEDEDSFILVMEKPDPCQNLWQYITDTDDITEAKARWIVRQLVQALKHCVDRGVFHGDVHLGNILMVTDDTLTLKLIDFGCARLITSEGFNSSEYRGAELYAPPEVLMDTVFYAEPAYVWAVGLVLFEIMHSRLPFKTVYDIQDDYLDMSLALSPEYRDLIFWCLMRDPAKRLTLEQLENHSWFEK